MFSHCKNSSFKLLTNVTAISCITNTKINTDLSLSEKFNPTFRSLYDILPVNETDLSHNCRGWIVLNDHAKVKMQLASKSIKSTKMITIILYNNYNKK